MLGPSHNIFSDKKYMSAWAVVWSHRKSHILLRDSLDPDHVYLVFPTRREARANKGEFETVVRVLIKKGCGR